MKSALYIGIVVVALFVLALAGWAVKGGKRIVSPSQAPRFA